MSNTSATGGPLAPSLTPRPLEGQALLDFFQTWFVGLTGLTGNLVRPSWQPEPPNLPANTTDWMAFRIKSRKSDVYAAELSADSYNDVQRHQILNIHCSFYGPNADLFASMIREGAQVSQNREYLEVASMGFVETSDCVQVPELVKDKWYNRVEMQIDIRRQLALHYPVLNILAADADLDNEKYVTHISVQGAP